MIPHWFTVLSIFMLGLGGFCFLWIAVDIACGHRQHMWIMNVVWPVVALFGTGIAVWGYYRYGRLATHRKMMEAKEKNEPAPSKTLTPFPIMVAKGASHCGSGCTLGDILAEFLALGFPGVLAWVGWKSVFPDSPEGKVFSLWVLDFIFAFVIGIVFQYFTIKPMRGLSVGEGIKQAIKADTFSLTAWQIGMYGGMAVFQFYLFFSIWGERIEANRPEFWFAMQIAMLLGFCTAYPVNWWLIRIGWKEKM